jgi:hypothetical protein
MKHNSNNSSLNYCTWCGAPTVMEKMQLPECPINEIIEDKIDKLGRQRVWGENSDWSKLNMDPDDEAELLVYDEMLATVSLKHVCEKCLRDDDNLWGKYYGDNQDDDNQDDEWVFTLEE